MGICSPCGRSQGASVTRDIVIGGGKKLTGQKRLLGHPVVKELLASFERAETALRKEDRDALMKFMRRPMTTMG